MNITTLAKCVEELKKETPNISYVLGMLETVIEMDRVVVPSYPSYPMTRPVPMPNLGSGGYGTLNGINTNTGSGLIEPLSDEEITAQRYAGGSVGNVQ